MSLNKFRMVALLGTSAFYRDIPNQLSAHYGRRIGRKLGKKLGRSIFRKKWRKRSRVRRRRRH